MNEMNNLINVIESPTRITSHSKSLIDVVIINNSKEKEASGGVGYGLF
jgi:hypothetical protein